ncbi:sugar ABC transporter ATP-binding protein [Paenibacillus selenitireducens]|uniref:Sugar ABC transporter ATP-binding protein n=1 Tax=Paenibacillus selenitireducens TaxID=1324314 RepID=A0A1T2XMG0_9BACL|nr:carbohydrate ABC transporter permease [Paenibacillus selenitireducens]OPA80853.1 sugar ABC transporter ATP-binding protein [Paenibacillus selenitireducens]
MNLKLSRIVKERIGKGIKTIIMVLASLLLLSPMIWMISTSFKKAKDVFTYPIQWIPQEPVLSNHIKVWTAGDGFALYYMNSLKISLILMIGAPLMAALAAYGFSRIEFKGRNAIFVLYLCLMMIPQQVLFVPKFIMFEWMHIYNTHWALILPGLFTVFGVFMIRQFFMSIPHEISEAALIDGAGHFRIFMKIFLPLSKPVLATFAIIDFTWTWNDYENALIFLLDKKLYTVPLGMQNFMLEAGVDYNMMMAAATAGVVPLLVVFFIGQKYIIQGFSSSAVKG